MPKSNEYYRFEKEREEVNKKRWPVIEYVLYGIDSGLLR
jgi:hypothetical protein